MLANIVGLLDAIVLLFAAIVAFCYAAWALDWGLDYVFRWLKASPTRYRWAKRLVPLGMVAAFVLMGRSHSPTSRVVFAYLATILFVLTMLMIFPSRKKAAPTSAPRHP
jgi:hypothetical protein